MLPLPGPASAADLVSRAEAMRPMLRAQQDEAERRGYFSPEVHESFLRSGLYHLLTPKRYGGYECDIPTFFKVIVEIARGDPATGWCLCLGHAHNYTTASYWSEEAQDEVFRNPKGYFRASHSAVPAGTARPVQGGYVVNARSPYQSGVPYSTHATVNVALATDASEPVIIAVLVPEGQFEMLDDWGGEATLGERASGSNTVVVEDQFVPSHLAVPFDWLMRDHAEVTPGVRLHDNPMYLGPVAGFFHGELVATMVGAARAALDEYEAIITSRTTSFPPIVLRSLDPNAQRELGLALTMADAAEAILLHAGEQHMQYCRDWAEWGTPVTSEMDMRLYGMIQRAGQLASEAVEMLFRSAGSSAAKGGQRMQRYYRDVSMYRGHNSAQYMATAQFIGMIHLGVPRIRRP